MSISFNKFVFISILSNLAQISESSCQKDNDCLPNQECYRYSHFASKKCRTRGALVNESCTNTIHQEIGLNNNSVVLSDCANGLYCDKITLKCKQDPCKKEYKEECFNGILLPGCCSKNTVCTKKNRFWGKCSVIKMEGETCTQIEDNINEILTYTKALEENFICETGTSCDAGICVKLHPVGFEYCDDGILCDLSQSFCFKKKNDGKTLCAKKNLLPGFGRCEDGTLCNLSEGFCHQNNAKSPYKCRKNTSVKNIKETCTTYIEKGFKVSDCAPKLYCEESSLTCQPETCINNIFESPCSDGLEPKCCPQNSVCTVEKYNKIHKTVQSSCQPIKALNEICHRPTHHDFICEEGLYCDQTSTKCTLIVSEHPFNLLPFVNGVTGESNYYFKAYFKTQNECENACNNDKFCLAWVYFVTDFKCSIYYKRPNQFINASINPVGSIKNPNVLTVNQTGILRD